MAECLKVNSQIHLKNCDNLCRLCGYYVGPMQSILIRDSTNTTYQDKIMYCMSINVSDSGKLPTQICKTCVKLVETFYAFKRRCTDVNLQFLELIKNDESEHTDSKKTSMECVVLNQQLNSSSSPITLPNVQAHFYKRTWETTSSSTPARQQDDTLPLKDSPSQSVGYVLCTQENLLQNTLQATVASIEATSSCGQIVLPKVSCVKGVKIEADDTSAFQTDPLELVTCSYSKDDLCDPKPNIEMIPITVSNNNNVEKQTENLVDVGSDVLPFEPPFMIKTTCDSRPSCIERACAGCGKTVNSNEQVKSNCICSTRPKQRDQRDNICKTFECKICLKMFKSKLTFSKHSKFHLRLNKFRCSICGIKCDGNKVLQTHFKSKHKEFKNLKCTFCKSLKQYRSVTSFLAHMRKMHDMGESAVSAGGTNDDGMDTLRSPTQSESTTECRSTSHVDKCLVSQGGERKIENIQHLACAICKQVFSEKQTLADHVDSHEKSDVKRKDASLCSYCGKTFGTSTLLSQHVRLTHLRTKTHQCKLCDKSYGKSSALRNHVESVHEKKKFQCSLCGGLLSSFNSFHSHMRMHRNKNKAPAVGCPVCPKLFRHKKNVERHMRSHTGETPYKCSHCPREFTLEWNLIQHERLHTGEKRYVCDKCGKAFTHNVSRKNHMKYHKDDA